MSFAKNYCVATFQTIFFSLHSSPIPTCLVTSSMSLRLALSAQCIKDCISFGSAVRIYRINYFSTSLKLPQSDTSGESTTPWYLRKDNTSKLEPLTHEKFPELPNDAPESVGNLVELLVKK